VKTNDTTWTLPENAVVDDEVVDDEVEDDPSPHTTVVVQVQKSGVKRTSFKKHLNKDGVEYFENVDNPNDTVWCVPKGAVVLDEEYMNK
jgi:hypothetical protein